MPKPVKEANPAPIPDFRGVTVRGEQFADLVLKGLSPLACADILQRVPLTFQYGVPEPALLFASPAPNHCARKIPVIAGLGIPRKDIEDDQRIRQQRSTPPLVWIAGLLASGDNGVGRLATRANDRTVDLASQNFRG